MDRRLGLEGKAVCGLGCGPGLYANLMVGLGAQVTGIDFSARSIEYARQAAKQSGRALTFEKKDYLKDDLPAEQNLVCLIYGDLCALSPEQRKLLCGKIHASLKPGDYFVLDVFSHTQFAQREEQASYERRLMDGFWAAGDYFGFLTTLLYAEQKIALDHYLIAEPNRTREIFNWLQYFKPESVAAELTDNGFKVEQAVDILSGEPVGPEPGEFAVITRR
ncbi:MAG: class I SAM-dependent methyltransferase [Rhodospirillales bacterium]|nr:class I SAM-dependent methyltransferase [Rhodospirillales bacterium]